MTERPVSRRRQPLRASPAGAPPTVAAAPGPPSPSSPGPGVVVTAARGTLLAVGVGVAVALAVGGIVYSLLAIPLYFLAQTEPSGLDRPFIRSGFFRVALPIGVVVGAVVGGLVGHWYAKGGRLPTDRTPWEH